MDPHTAPSDVCAAVYLDGPKQMNVYPLCGMDMLLDTVQTEFLRCGRAGGCRGSDPICRIPIALAPQWGSWSVPGITAPKWACFQVMVALNSSPFVIIPNALSIILDPTMSSTFVE